MANEYRAWYSSTEQEWVTQCDLFLQHVVGWYRVYTYSDTSSDRRFAYISEGEEDDKWLPRIIRLRGFGDDVYMDVMFPVDGGFNFTTGSFGTPYVGSSSGAQIGTGSTPGRSRCVANKDRLFIATYASYNVDYSGYVGYFDSFFTPAEDPYPAMVRGQQYTYLDWLNNEDIWILRSDETEVTCKLHWNNAAVNEGYPNGRNGQFSFSKPTIYYDGNAEFSEVRGKPKGLFYGRVDRLANGSFVNIAGDYYLVTRTADEIEAIVVGPVSSNGQVPINHGWPARPRLDVDYTYRGLELDTATSGTLALWRFDTGHLEDYKYGSGSALPVPSAYIDTAGNYDLAPQNSLTSVESRLREAADFDGSTHYASGTGDATSEAALKTEWTFECVFKPDTIPTASARATLIDYSTTGATSAENTLLRVSVSPAVGTTPDQYNVERGNLDIYWEEGTGSAINNLTTGDYIQQNRWNYIAIVKKYNGSNYDIDVWHCSFGDYVAPTKKSTFTNVNNAAGGSNSDWYLGATEDLANYFDGQIDDTRITERVLTETEIKNNCSRTML
jgi:hypothetical protein